MVTCLAAAVSLVCAAFTFEPERNLLDLGRSYFAPVGENSWRARLPEGHYRFFRSAGTDGNGVTHLSAIGGWRGQMKGDAAELFPGGADVAPGAVQRYGFRRGRLADITQAGENPRFNCPDFLSSYDDPMPPALWRTGEDMSEEELRQDMWKGSSRLRLFYKNPNALGALMAELAVLAAVLFFARGWIWKLHGFLLFGIAFWLQTLTQSRGALLALGLGLCAMTVLSSRVRTVLTWRRCAYALILAGAVCTFGYFGYRDRFAATAANRASDAGRTESLSSVPAMIACGPWGWKDLSPGLTYVSWFQDFEGRLLVRDMINEHLTFMVRHGWPLRFIYVFFWLFALLFLAVRVRDGHNPVGLGVLVVLGVTASLNRVYQSPTLFIIPAGCFLQAIFSANWRQKWRVYRMVVAGALVMTAAGAVTVQAFGSSDAARMKPSVVSDGTRVFIGGSSPVHWLVDEPTVLNLSESGKTIRRYYRQHPHTPALGFVREVGDLPDDARHVTLLGRSCERFVAAFKANPTMKLPQALTFVSPTIAPSAVPEELRRRCKLTVFIGEFLARHYSEDGDFPNWVRIVPGAEIYIPDYVALATDRPGNGPE